MDENTQTIIVDNGSGTMKFGIAGDDAPKSCFPTVIGRPKQPGQMVGKGGGLGSATSKDPGPWEGELRNMWKPTQQPALWFHGGNLHQSRHYSQFLSLQLKARMEGIPTPVYELAPVYHLK